MREDRVKELSLRGIQRERNHELLDQLGHLSTDHVGTQQRSGCRVEHRLHQTLCVAKRHSLSVAGVRKGSFSLCNGVSSHT